MKLQIALLVGAACVLTGVAGAQTQTSPAENNGAPDAPLDLRLGNPY